MEMAPTLIILRGKKKAFPPTSQTVPLHYAKSGRVHLSHMPLRHDSKHSHFEWTAPDSLLRGEKPSEATSFPYDIPLGSYKSHFQPSLKQRGK